MRNQTVQTSMTNSNDNFKIEAPSEPYFPLERQKQKLTEKFKQDQSSTNYSSGTSNKKFSRNVNQSKTETNFGSKARPKQLYHGSLKDSLSTYGGGSDVNIIVKKS